MAFIRLIMACTKDVIYLILHETYYYEIVQFNLEHISLDLSKGGIFPNSLAMFYVRKLLVEPSYH